MSEPATIDDYIRAFAPPVRRVLARIRATVAAVAPNAREKISYRMPTFVRKRVLVHFAAFQHHIGLFPPVRGDAALLRAVEPYAGPKGNLRFPFADPIPYGLIARIVEARVREESAGKRKPGVRTTKATARARDRARSKRVKTRR